MYGLTESFPLTIRAIVDVAHSHPLDTRELPCLQSVVMFTAALLGVENRMAVVADKEHSPF